LHFSISDVLIQIAKLTGANLHWLLTGEGSPDSNPEIPQQLLSEVNETSANPPLGTTPMASNKTSESHSDSLEASQGETFLSHSPLFSFGEILPPVQSVPTLIHSLPLTKPDRAELLAFTESQLVSLTRVQTIFHPDIVKISTVL
jgi:hypothetical protein